jgi:hypothetical protein
MLFSVLLRKSQGGHLLRSNIPRSALCTTLDTYNLYRFRKRNSMLPLMLLKRFNIVVFFIQNSSLGTSLFISISIYFAIHIRKMQSI